MACCNAPFRARALVLRACMSAMCTTGLQQERAMWPCCPPRTVPLQELLRRQKEWMDKRLVFFGPAWAAPAALYLPRTLLHCLAADLAVAATAG